MRRLFGLALGSCVAAFVAVSCGGTTDKQRSPSSDDENGGEGGAVPVDKPGSFAAGAGGVDGGAQPLLGGAGGEGGVERVGGFGGIGGVGGNGGVGGSEPAPYMALGCHNESLELNEDLVRFCVMASACSGGLKNIGWCLSNAAQDMSMFFYFLSNPNEKLRAQRPQGTTLSLKGCSKLETCDDLLECAGFRIPEEECQDSTEARCAGDLAINCGDNAGVTDCEHMTGLTDSCRVVGSGNLARALCVVDEACPGENGSSWCHGDMLRTCVDGLSAGIDCSRLGQDCAEPSPGFTGDAACAPPLPTQACNRPGHAYCDGDSPAYCNPDGLLFKSVACSAAGQLECAGAESMGDVTMGCFAPGCGAGTEDTDWGCQGDDYRFAIDGLEYRIHCAAFGFATCREETCAN